MKAQLAFYKGKGRVNDKLIRLWTHSEYSHCELLIDGKAYSSDAWGGSGARCLPIQAFNPNNWDYVDVEVDKTHAMSVFYKYEGKGYDWLGILLSQFLPLNRHGKSKVFCSELCAEMLDIPDAHKYAPEDLAKMYGVR